MNLNYYCGYFSFLVSKKTTFLIFLLTKIFTVIIIPDNDVLSTYVSVGIDVKASLDLSSKPSSTRFESKYKTKVLTHRQYFYSFQCNFQAPK